MTSGELRAMAYGTIYSGRAIIHLRASTRWNKRERGGGRSEGGRGGRRELLNAPEENCGGYKRLKNREWTAFRV